MRIYFVLMVAMCGLIAAQSSAQTRDPASRNWGPELVHDAEIGYRPCGDARDTPDCLRDRGLSEEAIAFSYMIEGDYSGVTVGASFRELGAVDLASARFIGNRVYEFAMLVNGREGINSVPRTENMSGTFRDAASQSMLRRFPRASSIMPPSVRAHRVLPDGTQRFVVGEIVTDGCVACTILGSAISYIDVTPSGTMHRWPVGLLLDPSANEVPMNAQTLQRRPVSLQARLNMLGYDAGPMDGVIGSRTRNALRGFKSDHCLPPNDRLDDRTAQSLMVSDGFDIPCAADRGGDADRIGEVLTSGIYVDNPEYCGLANLPHGEVHVGQRMIFDEEIVFGYDVRCEATTITTAGDTQFNGTCLQGNTSEPFSWRFSIHSRESFTDHTMPTATGNVGPRTFDRCADESSLRRNHAAWFPDTSGGARSPGGRSGSPALYALEERGPYPGKALPLREGVYATESKYCSDETFDRAAIGDRVGSVRQIYKNNIFHNYESFCGIEDYAQDGDRLIARMTCEGEGQVWQADARLVRRSKTAFVRHDILYTHCDILNEAVVAEEHRQTSASAPGTASREERGRGESNAIVDSFLARVDAEISDLMTVSSPAQAGQSLVAIIEIFEDLKALAPSLATDVVEQALAADRWANVLAPSTVSQIKSRALNAEISAYSIVGVWIFDAMIETYGQTWLRNTLGDGARTDLLIAVSHEFVDGLAAAAPGVLVGPGAASPYVYAASKLMEIWVEHEVLDGQQEALVADAISQARVRLLRLETLENYDFSMFRKDLQGLRTIAMKLEGGEGLGSGWNVRTGRELLIINALQEIRGIEIVGLDSTIERENLARLIGELDETPGTFWEIYAQAVWPPAGQTRHFSIFARDVAKALGVQSNPTPLGSRRVTVPLLAGQGLAGSFDVAIQADNDLIHFDIVSIEGQRVDGQKFNPVARNQTFDLMLHVSARKDCDDCRPTVIEASGPASALRRDGSLVGTNLPARISVERKDLVDTDEVGFSLRTSPFDYDGQSKSFLFLGRAKVASSEILASANDGTAENDVGTAGPREALGGIVGSLDNPRTLTSAEGCSLTTRIEGAATFEWSGDCARGGVPGGDGELELFGLDGKLIHRLRAGSGTELRFDDGRLRWLQDLDLTFAPGRLYRGNIHSWATTFVNSKPGYNHHFQMTIDRIVRAAQVDFTRRDGFTGDMARVKGLGVQIRSSASDNHAVVFADQESVRTGGEWVNYQNREKQAFEKERDAFNRDVETNQRQRAMERAASDIQRKYDVLREKLLSGARELIDLGVGNLEFLAAALAVDEVATLERLQDGVKLTVPKSDKFDMVEGKEDRNIRVSFSLKSPLQRLDFRERQELNELSFSWDLFQKQVNTAGRSSSVQLTCLFESLSDIPREEKTIQAELRSFSMNGGTAQITFNCD